MTSKWQSHDCKGCGTTRFYSAKEEERHTSNVCLTEAKRGAWGAITRALDHPEVFATHPEGKTTRERLIRALALYLGEGIPQPNVNITIGGVPDRKEGMYEHCKACGCRFILLTHPEAHENFFCPHCGSDKRE